MKTKNNKYSKHLWIGGGIGIVLAIGIVSVLSAQNENVDKSPEITERIACIEKRLAELESANDLTEIVRYDVGKQSSLYDGLEVAVINSHNIYAFWLEGELKKPVNISHQAPTYLLRSTTGKDDPKENLNKALSWYSGKTTVGTIWLKSDNGIEIAPLYFDNTGIYFQPISTFKNVSVLRFTQTLVLKDPQKQNVNPCVFGMKK